DLREACPTDTEGGGGPRAGSDEEVELSASAEKAVNEIFFDYCDRVRTPWGKRRARLDKGVDPQPLWDLKWANAWGTRGQKLFTKDDVDPCVREYEPPSNWAEVLKLVSSEFGARVAATGGGLDRAMSYMRLNTGDRTIWATVVRTDEHPCRYVVVQLDTLGEEISTEQLARMTEQERSERAMAEVLDASGRARMLGAHTHVLEQFQCQDLVGQIAGATLVAMSTPRKQRLYNMLGELIKSRRLIFSSAWPLLHKELCDIVVDTTGTQPRFTGRPHDDTVDAVLNAIDGVIPEGGELPAATAADAAVSEGRYEAAYG
ncbi:MAG TPA: hypothetical protein VM283_00765, partial [Armatimonadota bacterium]|nr:hypothetical protein [Armatimonadota bacterium]